MTSASGGRLKARPVTPWRSMAVVQIGSMSLIGWRALRSPRGFVLALASSSGSALWVVDVDPARPKTAALAQKRVFVEGSDDPPGDIWTLAALDLETGCRLWEFAAGPTLPEAQPGATWTPPIAAGDLAVWALE